MLRSLQKILVSMWLKFSIECIFLNCNLGAFSLICQKLQRLRQEFDKVVELRGKLIEKIIG